MSRPTVFRRVAQQEFDAAVAWYETRQTGIGLEFKDEVDGVLARISANPEHFAKSRGDIRRAVLRRFPYSIHFLPEPNRIVVLAVFHAKRDPRFLEGRV